jgi:hypothetical protein
MFHYTIDGEGKLSELQPDALLERVIEASVNSNL